MGGCSKETDAFPLPSSTPKSAINIKFSPTSLSLSITESIPASVLPLPSYSSKSFWDGISSSSSYWTWDKEADHSYGLLTLYLDKQHEGTKWMQVFASAGKSAAAELSPEDAEVPETLDPSELWLIRESLEKYTAALLTGEDASGLGLGRGVPSLGKGEVDEEVDASVGRSACLTWVGIDGSSPSWSNPGREYPFTLLSTPLPGHHRKSLPSLVLKDGVDGPVYVLQPASTSDSDAAPKWIHKSTFSALAFVLASKQDVRFTHHNENLVFALESGLRNRGGNMYVYRRVGPAEAWAKQAILKVDDGVGGALLGVGAVRVEDGRDVILALTEKQLVIVRTW
ncbi:hypothetical protein BT96DRAFT_644961 [Gymnopus androsaceus JB14]|uniref:NudC domain-containing protein 1 n=1 Tax=Gymnopus androsaceus JB14 TaxID=1447944 RepID=A0A6A4HQP7_9AGAR|nr:hypothetical protein BT96DRAFT_644961 [Gymnopus androsaceus JB14]